MKNAKLIFLGKRENSLYPNMAEKIGVSESYYEKIEYGDRTPSYNFLIKFKKAFPESNAEDLFLS